jgi:2-polyprenyl-6-methoxyphenol hydroxylase-like FAD-dependent oxidoreductase
MDSSASGVQASRTGVLVVGAGPTGLTMAAALAKLGVAARIVDKNSSRTQYSQALGVHAGTLEALGDFFGDDMPRQMVAAGHPARGGFLHFGERPPVHVDLSQIPSVYNFVLVLAQSETERFLEEQVTRGAIAVERQTELVSIRDTGTRVEARLGHADGRGEDVVADYAVGCDGAHSTVRHAAGIAFAGGAYTGDFLLGDVTIRWPMPYDAVHVFFSPRGILACLPMKGETGFFRLILVSRDPLAASSFETASERGTVPFFSQGTEKMGQSPGGFETARSGPDQAPLASEEFCRILARLSPVEITVTSYTWLSRFRLHHRMAERFQSGRLFLAGDAGHIHSPVGGQGMNTGIQDALSLASKIAAVARGGAPLGVLEEYQKERLPVARAVVHGTDLAFRAAAHANRGLAGWLRATLAPIVIRSRFVQKRLARTVSQVDVARRDIERRRRLAAAYPRTGSAWSNASSASTAR